MANQITNFRTITDPAAYVAAERNKLLDDDVARTYAEMAGAEERYLKAAAEWQLLKDAGAPQQRIDKAFTTMKNETSIHEAAVQAWQQATNRHNTLSTG